MKGEKYLVIYHKDDNDGVMSAAIALKYILDEIGEDQDNVTLKGIHPNEFNEWCHTNEVKYLHEKFDWLIMTDCSCNDEKVMKMLHDNFTNRFIWVDHHAPIIKASYKFGFDDIQGVRQTDRSAILNMYKFLFDPLDEQYNSNKVPRLLEILSAWDSWNFSKYDNDYAYGIDQALNVLARLNVWEMAEILDSIMKKTDSGVWEKDTHEDNRVIAKLTDMGEAIAKYNEMSWDNLMTSWGDTEWKVAERPAVAVFVQGNSTSKMFKSCSGYDAGIVFKKNSLGGGWSVSIYNIRNSDTFNCGDYAREKFGGGGHQGAAGFRLSDEQFAEISKTKSFPK
jgi:oligoribonuclease NrnB/cAMP/cGMP phosphodiesterase (DHH superfamily)